MKAGQRARGVAWATIAMLALSCATAGPGPRPVPPELEARAQERWQRHQRRAGAISSLAARARTTIEGATGASFSRQRLWLERPAQMRLEVDGPFGQPALVVATDGTHVDVYRRGVPGIAHDPVHDGTLFDLVGIPLSPKAAVAALLAAPDVGRGPPRAIAWDGASGDVELGFPTYTLWLDAEGRLRRLRWHPGGHDWFTARYEGWVRVGDAAFPEEISLAFPTTGGSATLRLRDVVVNPQPEPARFRIEVPEPLSSAGGESGG